MLVCCIHYHLIENKNFTETDFAKKIDVYSNKKHSFRIKEIF